MFGKPVAQKIYENLQKEIAALKTKKITPTMAVVLIGSDSASISYVRVKEKRAAMLEVDFNLFHLPGETSQAQVGKILDGLNKNKYISGIIVQLPLPRSLDEEKIIGKISPAKDIDGLNGGFPAPTAQGILEIFRYYHIDLANKKIALVGHGRLVGRPLEILLKKRGLNPKIYDAKSTNIKAGLKAADIIISATGVPGLIRPEMVTPRSIIIDAGTAEAKGKIAGDVSPQAYDKVRAYSPVPGGVGPVTVAMLMKNVVSAAKKQNRRNIKS